MAIVAMLTEPSFHQGNATVFATVEEAILAQIEACQDYTAHRSPTVIYDHRRVVLTVVPSNGMVHLVSPEHGIQTVGHLEALSEIKVRAFLAWIADH